MRKQNRPTKASVVSALRAVRDPELGIDIVSLGLVYNVVVEAQSITVRATLTTPGCPLADDIMREIRHMVLDHAPSHTVHVELTFDPPWSPDMIESTARAALGRKPISIQEKK